MGEESLHTSPVIPLTSIDEHDESRSSRRKPPSEEAGPSVATEITTTSQDDEDETETTVTSATTDLMEETVNHTTTATISASVVEQLYWKQSVFSSIFPNGEDVSDENHGQQDTALAIGLLSSNPSLLNKVLLEAGTKEWESKELEYIRSNPFYWAFYLSMLDRLRSHVRAGEVIASGNVATTSGFRNDVIAVAQT